MAYTFLDRGLNPIGVLTNKGGQTNNYWGDQITHSIATGNDVLTSVSLSIDKETTNIDTSGNQKEWNHTIQGLSFGIDGIGREVDELNYLMYKDGEMGRHYLMTITQVDESLTQSGFHFKTVQGINAAAYDLSRKTLRAKEFGIVATGSVAHGTAQNILGYIFDGLGWDVRTIGSFPAIDYSVQDGVTAQSVLQDIIKLFDSSVDAYVLINNLSNGSNVFTGGGSIKRVFDFSTDIGRDEGQTIRLNKNLVSLTKTGARDSMYTKLFVSGNGITIGPANNGSDYIVDDDANRKYNVLGANSVPVQYLEGAISNSAISDPKALLTWGKKQLAALNHPRFNYVVSSVDGKNVHLGDTVVIQDLKASQPIMLKSKIISKTLSFADPQTDSFIVGEFSPIVITSRNGNTDDIIQMVNQANQVASEANEKANQANTVASSAATKADEANNKVETVFDDAKEYADNLSEKNKELLNSLSSDLQNKSDSLYASQQTIASQASAYTSSAVADANAKAEQIGQTTAQNAQKALDEAKKDLTSSLASQASQTASMASDVTSKANQYASQAKSEAIAAAISADGVVRTDFKKTTDSMTATIQQVRSDADGKISVAQTTATQALDGLSTKVEKTEYNKTTGDLTSKINKTSETAEQSKQDIVDIKDVNGKQDERMLEIEKDANGIKQTVSDLQTVQGNQSGYISTLQQRADGFDATVSKIQTSVNNLGQINQLFNTEFSPDFAGWYSGQSTEVVGEKFNTSPLISSSTGWNLAGGKYNGSNVLRKTVEVGGGLHSDLIHVQSGSQISMSIAYYNSGEYNGNVPMAFYVRFYDANKKYVSVSPFNGSASTSFRTDTYTVTVPEKATYVSLNLLFNGTTGTIYYSQPMLVFGKTVGSYAQGNYNNNDAVAKAQLTADNATLEINNYKTDADGRISKAQADIKVNADAISTKVAKTDFDKKTGELTTSVNKAQQTADTATQTIGTYKESNDRRVTAAETNITANSDAIKLTASKTELNQATGKLSGDISTLQQRADGFDATVAKVNNLSVGGRNLLLDTGRSFTGVGNNSTNGNFNAQGGEYFLAGDKKVSDLYNQYGPTGYLTISFDWVASGSTISGQFNPQWSGTPWGGLSVASGAIKPSGTNKSGHYESSVQLNYSGYSTGSALSVMFRQDNLQGNVTISNMKLEAGNVATDWTPAPEDLSVGGRNYIINSSGMGASDTARPSVKPSSTTSASANATIAYNNEFTTITYTGTGTQEWYYALAEAYKTYESAGLDKTKQYTISVDVRGTVPGVAFRINNVYGPSVAINNSTWTRLKYTFKFPDLGGANADKFYIRMNAISNGATGNFVKGQTLSFRNFKLEEGNVATDWTPAPEDIESSVAQLKITADGVYQMVNDPKTGLNTRVSTAEGNITKVQGTVNGMSNTITQTANGLTQEIADRKTGDSNILQAGKDFTTSQIKSYDTGMQSQLSQTSNALIARISSLNLLNNSQFEVVNGMLPGWHADNPWGATVKVGPGTSNNVSVNGPNPDGTTSLIHDYGGNSLSWLYSDPIPTMPNSTYSGSFELAEGSGWATSSQVPFARYIRYYTSDHVLISSDATNYFGGTIGGSWPRYSFTVKTPANAAYISFGMGWNGGKISFRQPAMYGGSKDYGYMPSSKSGNQTVLQLFKDNWSIGINDNTGALISGINGDKSGMQIAGKHIVLTGDTTIQSGFTLTVDHLVGDTAKFIKTNWESAFSNIRIDGDGITIASKNNKSKTIFKNGDTNWWSPRGENIGYIGITTPIVNRTNADYMTIGVNGWQTTTKGDSHYDFGSPDFYGGDGIMFGVTDENTDKTGSYRKLMSWESSLTAGYLGVQTGWHAWEQYEFHKNVKVDGAMNVSGNLTTGGDINLGWTLRKNGTGFYPAHFNSLPGIHIVGTNSGIVFNESANKFYVIMGGHWNEISLSGIWGTGSWDN